MNATERNRIIAASEEWNALGSALGWRLYGFTYDRGASFFDTHNCSVHLTGRQRDDILRAMASAQEVES